MDPFIVPTVPKISVVPATPDSNTFRKNIKNQNLDITSQCQNSIEEVNDNHFDFEVNNLLNTFLLAPIWNYIQGDSFYPQLFCYKL